jgi:hypothetical protein
LYEKSFIAQSINRTLREENKLRRTLFYAIAIVLIISIIAVAVVITYSESVSFPTFPVKGNINPPYNQAEIVLQYEGKWIGGYSFQNSNGKEYFRQELNGTGNMQLIVNRPNNTTPWIIYVLIQSSRAQGNVTLSLCLPNGTLIDTITRNTHMGGHIMSITVNMENLTSSHSANDYL